MKSDGGLAMLGVVMVIAYVVNPIIGTFLGGIAGWAVGLIYGNQLLTTMMSLGLNVSGDWTFWDLGCLFGFIGGFFKGFKI